MKTVILVNVGTPNSPSPDDVGRYLREFLMDENILPLPRPFRDILVKGLIVPRRKHSSAAKYKTIWTDEGSPLMVESLKLQKDLQQFLGPLWQVHLGMQVGQPALKQTLQKALAKGAEVHVVPLYPQFATATTGGVLACIRGSDGSASVQVTEPFYNQPWFLKSQAARIQSRLQAQDHLLLSYHGLPVSQLKKHRPACMQSETCCEQSLACAENCYKAQALQTSRLLQKELGLPSNRLHIGFQSRLGRSQWIEPSTEQVMKDLVGRGVKHLKVACPSFVSDCLETLEEIGLELSRQFYHDGGEDFELIECINNHEIFVQGLGQSLQRSDSDCAPINK